mgnify:CR=1 FL=1
MRSGCNGHFVEMNGMLIYKNNNKPASIPNLTKQYSLHYSFVGKVR